MTQMRATGGGLRKTKNILSHHFHDWNIPSDWLCLTLLRMSGFQWVATPLSDHVYFVLITRVDQVRDPALHRIELKTSRSIAQRLAPLHYVGYVFSVQFTVYIIQAVRNSCSPLSSAGAEGQKIKIEFQKITQCSKFCCVDVLLWNP